MSRSRAKGTRFEKELVDYLHAHGAPHAERRALAGNLDKGDITGIGPALCIEAKNCARTELAEWVDQARTEAQNAGADIPIVVHKRRGKPTGRAYATVELETLCALLRAAGYFAPEPMEVA